MSQQCPHLSIQNVAEPVKTMAGFHHPIHHHSIIFKCICKLCSLLFCQFKQIKIIFAQIVINMSENWSLSLYSSAAIFPTVQNNLTPSLEMDKFCALDTFPHSGNGQAWLIKALCGLSKHSSGPVTLARGNWRADHVTGVDFKGRTAAAASQKEGSVYACPSLEVLRNEGKDSLNRCSGFQGWKSSRNRTKIYF